MTVLADVMGAIADRWEALTPPRKPSVLYRRVRAAARGDAPIVARGFYFVPASSGVSTQWESSFTTLRSTFEAYVRIDLTGRNFEDVFVDVADEGVLLLNAINLTDGGWPAGTSYVRAEGFRVEPAPDEDSVDIVITFTTETDESVGAPA